MDGCMYLWAEDLFWVATRCVTTISGLDGQDRFLHIPFLLLPLTLDISTIPHFDGVVLYGPFLKQPKEIF
jgi:hypothetical protein